ncbi:MAG: histidine kinase [Gemmatimonadales bacterium]
MQRSRSLVWPQLVVAWLPVWVLYAVMIGSAHPGVSHLMAATAALWSIAVAAALGILVQRLTDRLTWTYPFTALFLLIHTVAAFAYSASWVAITFLSAVVVHSNTSIILRYLPPSVLILGLWLYVMVAGASYAIQATGRAAQAEAVAAKSQLAALRAQLNPHFLFNALHTVVHLIPREPKRASQAAEQLASLLRTGIEEDRDLIPLSEELAFVERYLSLERIRFAERLDVRVDLPEDLRMALVPSFSLQSLVENAVRHGATPREEPTSIVIGGSRSDGMFTFTVSDSGEGATEETIDQSKGTGISRLRDRLRVLYGDGARLDISSEHGRGFTAAMSIPYADDE